MPIGSMYSRISGSRLSALIIRHLGVLDLHTHLRLRPLLAFAANQIHPGKTYRVLEIGCGDGVNGLELARLAGQRGAILHYRGIDIDPQCIERARRIAQTLGLEDHIQFSRMEAGDVASFAAEPSDILILADVLEHVDDPERLLRDLRPALAEDSLCLVSVPTPNYERVFDSSFHRKVGHVRSGYRLEELNSLFAGVGGRLIAHSYSTGLLGSLGCAVYYRLPATRGAVAAKSLLLSPFRLLDLYNSPSVSCSLFAAYSNHGVRSRVPPPSISRK
ncbi:MAG: class I SAM-dependent methyltransferase [Phycisphaerales bacterium]|jgi:SAM-dependent methyltransferase